ncbi:MAG: hypothetical protein ACOC6J_12205 [Spirochaetota bacterium]
MRHRAPDRLAGATGTVDARSADVTRSVLEKELDIRGVNRYCNTFPTAIRLMSERRVDLRPLVSHRCDFSSVTEAFAVASSSPSETMKVMVGPAGTSNRLTEA